MLHYAVSGDPNAPLVVYLHGVNNSSLWWAPLIDKLGEGFHSVTVDALGHGQSRRFTDAELERPFEASVDQAVELITFVSELFGKKPLLVGHSMGGAIATAIAVRHPDMVRGLVLADPAWLNEEFEAFYRAQAPDAYLRAKRWAEDPAGAIAENAAKRPWSMREHINWIYGQANVDLDLVATGEVSFQDNWLDMVSQISVPTTVVTSDGQDCIVGAEGKREVDVLGNQNVTVLLLPGGEHSIVPEFLDQFAAEIIKLHK